jgi:hypothetical protein
LFGALDEPAGVDDQQLGLVWPLDWPVSGPDEQRTHRFRVDLILRATERDERKALAG